MNEPKHSPLPWRAIWCGVYRTDKKERIAECVRDSMRGYDDDEIAKADAALIVKAVNGYEWFLKALPIVEDYLAERRREYEMWSGREDTGKARAIKAEIAECEGILKAAKGGGIYG